MNESITSPLQISFEILHKHNISNEIEFKSVKEIASELKCFLNQELVQSEISLAHRLYAKSSEIQEIFREKAEALGFSSEKKGLFSNYETSSLRPDYFKALTENTGIIMEVERGKTTINNMDLLDVWKCHICENANYLFLIIPKIRQNNRGAGSPTFNTVHKRLKSFFIERNYINIEAIFLFGY